MSTVPKRLFVYKTDEFTEFSILLEETWIIFRLCHDPTEKMILWIEDIGFEPQGEEISELESDDDRLLACVRLMRFEEGFRAQFGVLCLHFENIRKTASVVFRNTGRCEPTEF